MNHTGQENQLTSEPGFGDMTGNEFSAATSVLEQAMMNLGMCPADELAKLSHSKTGATMASQIANIFARKNPHAAVPWERAHQLFSSPYQTEMNQGRIFTLNDWRKFIPDLNLDNAKRFESQLKIFPWRKADLTGPAISNEGQEWQSSFAFLALPQSETNVLLKYLKNQPDVKEGLRISARESFPHALYYDSPLGKWEWVLMPTHQTISLTGEESQLQRQNKVPEGYISASFRDTLNFAIGCLLTGTGVSTNGAGSSVKFVCESTDAEDPHVLQVTIDSMTDANFGLTHVYLAFHKLDTLKKLSGLILPIKKKLPEYYLRLQNRKG